MAIFDMVPRNSRPLIRLSNDLYAGPGYDHVG